MPEHRVTFSERLLHCFAPMKLRALLIACLVAGCGGKTDDDNTPPPATFSDATPDTGNKKDTGILADTSLLADASDVMSETPDCVTGKTCIGSEMPTWMLEDFQPKSPGFKKTYGLSSFMGKVTVVALLSGW
jgi:hypothetical protein